MRGRSLAGGEAAMPGRLLPTATLRLPDGGRGSWPDPITPPPGLHSRAMTELTADSPAVHTRQPSLSGRTAVISGGTSGIGRAIAALLAAEGAQVLVFARQQEELDQTLAELRPVSGRVVGAVADQSNPGDVKRVFSTADRELGQVDILVNNAGVFAGAITDEDDDAWRLHLHTDLDGYIDCTRHAVARMRRQGGGHIVNIGSMSAVHRTGGHSLYVAAKAAIAGYSEALREEVDGDGIKVSLIEPGMVGTPIFGADSAAGNAATQHEREQEGSMLKPQDVAVAVHYCLTQPDRCTISLLRIEPRVTSKQG